MSEAHAFEVARIVKLPPPIFDLDAYATMLIVSRELGELADAIPEPFQKRWQR